MQTINANDDDDPIGILRAVELTAQEYQDMYRLDGGPPDEELPPWYGVLGKTYEWRLYQEPAKRGFVRAWCMTDSRWMTLTFKVDPRYGPHNDRFTRGPNAIMYNGKLIQCWECRDCGQWVVK